MNFLNLIKLLGGFIIFTFIAPLAHATKCGQVVYNKHGMLRKYEVLPLDLSEAIKKHGVSSTSSATTETSTASVDPGVTTGASDSQTQSVSTKGDCIWGGFFGAVDREDFEKYVEQNMPEIKNQIALGQGGHIEILAAFGDSRQPKALGQTLQKNMKYFVDFTDNESKAFVQRFQDLILKDSQLSIQCKSASFARNN